MKLIYNKLIPSKQNNKNINRKIDTSVSVDKKKINQKLILLLNKNQLKVQFQLKFQIIQIKILMNTKII